MQKGKDIYSGAHRDVPHMAVGGGPQALQGGDQELAKPLSWGYVVTALEPFYTFALMPIAVVDVSE